MSIPTRWTRIAVGALAAAAAWGVMTSTLDLKIRESASESDPTVFYLPKAAHIRPFLLGHEAFLADLIWIRTLGYFADELFGARRYTYLEGLIDLATDLDPRFEKIYIWAGAVMMYNSGVISRAKIEASNRILEKGWRTIQNDPVGWRHHPQYWMIPQMLGFNYAVELRDKQRGAPYIAATARIPGSPDLYKTYAATLYKKAGQWEEGSQVLVDMLAIETLNAQLGTAAEPEVRQRIRDRLIYYYRHLYGEGWSEKLRMIEERLEALLADWRATAPFISFELYLALRPAEPESRGAEELRSLWSAVARWRS